MAGITLAQAEAQLAQWLAASTALASGQSYSIDTAGVRRQLTRVDAAEVRTNIDYWQRKVSELAPVGGGGRRRTRYVVTE
jgi:Family of unknown function (DUF6148)